MALPEGRRDTRRERRKGKGGDAQNTARHAPLRKTRQNAILKTAKRNAKHGKTQNKRRHSTKRAKNLYRINNNEHQSTDSKLYIHMAFLILECTWERRIPTQTS